MVHHSHKRALGRTVAAVAGAICIVLAATTSPSAAEEPGITVKDVQVRIVDHGIVVLLIAGERFIPIQVDATVAGSIHSALSGTPSTRPLSHDLMRLVLLELGAKVTGAVITLKENTYYGDLTIVMGERTWIFDGRSSDAIALAILFKAPIIVAKPTWDAASQSWSTKPNRETS